MRKIKLLLVCALIIIVGCGNNIDHRVYGKWVEDKVGSRKVFTFNEDGTYSAYYPSDIIDIKDINDKGTYTTKEIPNPKKWKNGGCVIVLDSDYGNDYELDFIAYEKGDSAILTFYRINTDRNGNVSISNEYNDMGIYIHK